MAGLPVFIAEPLPQMTSYNFKFTSCKYLTCKYMKDSVRDHLKIVRTSPSGSKSRQAGPPHRGNVLEGWREHQMSQSDDTKVLESGETPGAVARYIAAMAGELSKIAKRNGLDTLGTLLEMARLEADQATKQ
jgi:hypothetical protein